MAVVDASQLDRSQREAVDHRGGRLLVVGGPGTGKTTILAQRLGSLARAGISPQAVLLLVPTDREAGRLAALAEESIVGPFEQLSVFSYRGFAARMLREEAQGLGLDPFLEPVDRHQRLAMLLAELDDLPLREHQIRGEPARLVAGFMSRIDDLKAELKTPADLQAEALELERSAHDEAHATAARMEREFAEAFARHDLILRRAGALDDGDLLMEAVSLLRARPDVRRRVRGRFDQVLVDDLDRASTAELALLQELAVEDGATGLVATSSMDLPEWRRRFEPALTVRLERSHRCGGDVLDAARAIVAGTPETPMPRTAPRAGGEVVFWSCESERAQAQAVAREVSGLLAGGVAPEAVCVLVDYPARHGRAVAAAFDERALPHRVLGAGELLRRPEVRDLVAWLRVLVNPSDAGAAVRALTRPPVGLRSIDLARVTGIARRRKLDMISALRASLESPQLPPEARDRIVSFLDLYGAAAGALDEMRPDVFVHRLTQRVGLRRQQLFAAKPETVARLVNVARLAELASAWSSRHPHGSTREFMSYLTAVADSGLGPDAAPAGRGGAVTITSIRNAQLEAGFGYVYVLGLHAACPVHPVELARGIAKSCERLILSWSPVAAGSTRPSPLYDAARAALGAEEEMVEEDLFGPAEGLQSTFRLVRDEVLDTVSQVGGGLSDMRLDTYMDLNRAVARYLELLKVAALVQRPAGQPLEDSLKTVNELLASVATREQRELLEASALDEFVLDAETGERRRRSAMRARHEPSLEAFIPRRGEGLALSATDIYTYRTCPLRYKFARVFSIPKEPTIHQRFGIVIHQVLERFHSIEPQEDADPALGRILALFDASWRRSGFGTADEELQLRDKAIAALTRFWERQREERGKPVWFERSFAFRIGPHHLRGRIDRVDQLPDGGYELIDYKTGRPRSPEELRDDVQLSLYGMGAREAWKVDPEAQSYYYILDDRKVAVRPGADEDSRVQQVVLEIGEGILEQDFEPTPSPEACGACDYRLVCPAAEV
jgi:DNA helicase II / ATP-dependent DNA helicase PcrA